MVNNLAIVNVKCVNFNFYLVFADMSYATDMHDILCVVTYKKNNTDIIVVNMLVMLFLFVLLSV